ncbi:hypothetical protein [Paenibacillus barengoltzii]|uniref:Secreted protein n=1 Tax=Paenibacillus barengoltzii G22 TaxID=1235795 RepID=R9LBZ1_9BACL|nr:hypothetical protein [Paenibacillus barengoltzii]EOS56103.1 hypothetical protein C812_02165 [Paenibacillus barengoltzii G22]
MRNFTILIFSTFFLLVGFAGSVSAEEQAITPIQIQSSAQSLNPEMTIQPQALPCDYYADGQHRLVLVGTQSVGYSGGSHSAIIKNPDGSQQAVNCNLTNWYEVKTYSCACGRASQQVQGNFIRTTHQYNHN